MARLNTARNLEIATSQLTKDKCVGCVMGKGHRTTIPKLSTSKSNRLLELVHSDVNGPLEIPSLGGSRYFVTFVDDFSRWTVMYTMKAKSETLDCFKKYHLHAERHTGQKVATLNVIKRTNQPKDKIKILRTDNGGEYISNSFTSYLESHGIKHQLTVAYTPQQNGVAERMNRTLMDCTRSMLHGAKLEKEFWAEALSTSVFIRNRVLSRSLPNNETPYLRWMGKIPDVAYFRVFGCKCWYVIPKSKVSKLQPRSKEGRMLGYSTNSKGYKIWDVESKSMVVSRDVTFDESSLQSDQIDLEISEELDNNVSVQGGESKEKINGNIDSLQADGAEVGVEDEYQDAFDEQMDDNESLTHPPLRRSARIRKTTGEWWKKTSLLAHALSAQPVPNSFRLATAPENIDFWKPGIEKEHDCLLRNETWKLVDYQNGMHVLPSMYVFKVKNNAPKVRLVALGSRQIAGIDFNETYAPVVTLTTVRTLLALVAHLDLELEQMDVVTAFLNGDLKEEIFMAVPEGLQSESTSGKVCKLLKSLYGLKQSPRQWYAKMHSFLVNRLEFRSSPNDPCLYTRHSGSSILLIALYVDDLLIAGSVNSEVQSIKNQLAIRFEMKDLGVARVMLGIEISRDRTNRNLFINQSEYANTILERFGMVNARPVVTPMEKSYAELSELPSKPARNVPYRQVIGSLMWLMVGSRPDLAYAIGRLAQHSQSPTEYHWIAIKRVLRYINGTKNHGILYDRSLPINLKGYSDSDWAGCRNSRKSTSGYIFLVAGGAVSWRSKRQTCVALSSCEAEYVAMCLATRESIWLSRLLCDLRNQDQPKIAALGVDNDGSIDTAQNTAINQRNKHIDLQYHFVRDAVQSKRIRLEQCDSQNQMADPMTKPLDRILFEKLRSVRSNLNQQN